MEYYLDPRSRYAKGSSPQNLSKAVILHTLGFEVGRREGLGL